MKHVLLLLAAFFVLGTTCVKDNPQPTATATEAAVTATSAQPTQAVTPAAYEPCANKACGDSCRVCPPNDPDCFETAVLKFCQPDNTCQMSEPDCG